MEIRDLYDKDRNLTGETILKGEQIPENRYIIVMLIFIQNSEGKFLIQKRSKQKNGLLAATGGHAKSGETSIQAIQTEVKEEIGLDLPEDKIELYFSGRQDEERVFFDDYYIKLDIDDISNLKLQEEEVESVCWMTKDEIIEAKKNGTFFMNHFEEFETLIDWLEDRKNGISITQENSNKEQYMELLLEADPSKELVNHYLNLGELFVLKFNDDVACVAVVVRIDDVDFILTTLWSMIPPQDEYFVWRGLNDFRQIMYNGHRLTIDDYNMEHKKCLSFLKRAVEESTAKHIVVVSHHLPTKAVVAPQHQGSLLNSAFATEFGNYIADSRISVWIYGHSHTNIDTTLGNTRIASNQLGYVGYQEHLQNGFNPQAYIELKQQEDE